jgi:peptidoglycan biosynthesis protein MviN/MurJ (putative lipid II flippase)
MIPFVLASSFLYGITLFHEARLKFRNKYSTILAGFILALLLSIVLNIILIPIFDYRVAAVNTLISYAFLYGLFYKTDQLRYIYTRAFLRFVGWISIILLIICISIWKINHFFSVLNMIPFQIIEGMLALFLVYLIVYRYILNNRNYPGFIYDVNS